MRPPGARLDVEARRCLEQPPRSSIGPVRDHAAAGWAGSGTGHARVRHRRAPRPSPRYRRREPERTVLYETVRAHLKTFLAEMEQRGDGAGLPGFVVMEFERYLACGILANGFARVRCSSCGDEMLVAFSCKGRGSVLPAPRVACGGLRPTYWTACSRTCPCGRGSSRCSGGRASSSPGTLCSSPVRSTWRCARSSRCSASARGELERRVTDGRGELRAAVRRCAQPERTFSLRDSGRRLRPRGGERALHRTPRTV